MLYVACRAVHNVICVSYIDIRYTGLRVVYTMVCGIGCDL